MDAHQHLPEGRATYPPDAVRWLVGTDARSVLELGAGAGGLTDLLVGLGHDVHATDPSADAVAVLAERLPAIRTSVATAEVLPVMDRSVDVVACAQVFDQFTAEATLTEITRVLRPGGHLALLWNTPDTKIPWVRKLAAIVDPERSQPEAPPALVRSDRFGFVDSSSHRHWQTVHRESLCEVARQMPYVMRLDEAGRDRCLDQVRALYDDYERGPDGMQLPWIAHCFRSAVVDNPWATPRQEGVNVPTPEAPAPPADEEPRNDPGDDGDLLIDFR